MKKRLIAAGLMLAMFTGSAYAVSSYTKTINVEYGVSLNINGETPTLMDVNGKAVQPFTYNGTTYVPIRAVAESFMADVFYNEDENTAYVYDDYTEYITAAAKVRIAIDYCENAKESFTTSIFAGTYNDYSTFMDSADRAITSANTMLSGIKEDNTYYSYLDAIVSNFTMYTSEYYNAERLFKQRFSEKTPEHDSAILNRCGTMAGYSMGNLMLTEDIFNRANWRTFE